METITEKSIIHILRNIPIFQSLNGDEFRKIIPLLQLETHEPESYVIKEGTVGDSMFIIINGAVKITKKDDDGEELFILVLYGGSYFGEFSLIDNMPRSASVVPIETTRLFRLKKEDFDRLLNENERFARLFYKSLIDETFSRFRDTLSNFTFSQHILKEKTSVLNEINRDLTYAKKVQRYFINTELLDSEAKTTEKMRHSYIYQPCQAIGGDFLNIVSLDSDHFGIIIADVMGHGITAALATGVLKSAFSIAVDQLGMKPLKLMSFLNRHFMSVISQLYATCYYSLIDTQNMTITMTKAGHHHPLFWKENSHGYTDIDCYGTGLGLMQRAEFGQVDMKLEPGDKILYYTDGIIEQKNAETKMYSENRLRSVFRELIVSGEKKILARLYDDVKDFADGVPLEDDITLFLLEF